MQPLQQSYIAGSKSGYINYQKPFLTPDDAYQTLENALVYRDRVIERPGMTFFGRLRRTLTAQSAGTISAAGSSPPSYTKNLFSGLVITETNAEITPGNLSTITITIGTQTLTDTTGNGILVVAGAGVITSATLNYSTWVITFTTNAALIATPITVTLKYYPGLPVMGIRILQKSDVNDEKTIFFDTKYAYVNLSGNIDDFNEYLGGTATWSGTNSDFFYTTNWRGSNAYQRLFFVTNFVNNASNPMRYTDDFTWTSPFKPAVDAANFLTQARILIPYYGRLIALNTYEGTDYGTANNYYARARFSQIGDPTAADAWRSDQFGKGGFIDAPTDEAIISAIFFKNTLIVGFEASTWQLRYVGEYGLPFIWERISSDFGCESTFSPILFDQGVLQVGDRAIVSATATNVQRIDEQIPDLVFSFKNDEFGKARVYGIRDFQNELVYWCYVNNTLSRPETSYTYPNSSLVYNYRNNTYATWRNNVTCFGIYQNPLAILWTNTTIKWSDTNTYWRSNGNVEFPNVVCGNQQGYINNFTTALYDGNSIDEQTLSIHAIDLTVNPAQITVPNHNLADKDWIRITNALFNITDPGINGNIYQVRYVDINTLSLYHWDIVTQNFIAVDFTNLSPDFPIYEGLGQIAFYPVMNIVSKDFNPYQQQGSQVKLSYIDFLVDAQPRGQFAVNLYINTFLGDSANIITGNKNVEEWYSLFGYITNLTIDNTNVTPCIVTSPNHGLRTGQTIYITNVVGTTQINNLDYVVTYIDANNFSIAVDQSTFSAYIGGGDWLANETDLFPYGSNYAWHRFFATTTGQFVTYQITYNNDQMSNLSTQRNNLTLNAVSLYTRPGSRNVF